MKSRFCPSPTGYIHLGNARTALFNALIAMHEQGVLLLRMEDTDPERSKKAFAEALEADLQWMGIHWQEGDGVGGDHGPYWQSERSSVYEKYYDQLIQNGDAYPCFCTEDQLALSRKIQRSQGKPPRYAGTCSNLSQSEVDQKVAAGLKPTLRFRMPKDDIIVFEDLVRGTQQFQSNDLGDFVIRRGDGGSTFMFCNAIDDSVMGVTIAMRGEDHLTNTPRQLCILKSLGLKAPKYGHISLILGSDGAPLSKRNGSQSIQDLQSKGYLPIAVVNYLARLGHYYADERLLSFEDLAKQFTIEGLGKAPAKFDLSQLLHWQKEGLAQLNETQAWEWMAASVESINPGPNIKNPKLFAATIIHNIHFPVEARTWAERLYSQEPFLLSKESQEVLLQTPHAFFDEALKALKANGPDYQAICEHLKTMGEVKGKKLFQPLRIALTGQMQGPELAPLCELMGEEQMQIRFEQALRGTHAGNIQHSV